MRTPSTLATLLLGLIISHTSPLHAGHDGGGTGHGGGGGGGTTLGDLECGMGEIAKYDGAKWDCAADEDTDTNTDTLADLPSCLDGDVAIYDGFAWNCESSAPPAPGGSLPILVDSDDPPKEVGPVFPLSTDNTVMVVFIFEGQTYQLVGTPSSLKDPHGGTLFFANDTCTELAFLNLFLDKTWPSISFFASIPTAAGTEFWVQGGAPTVGFLAFSRTDNNPPFCSTTDGFPRPTSDEVIPMRNTGIIFEDEFPPPYDVINWPTLP